MAFHLFDKFLSTHQLFGRDHGKLFLHFPHDNMYQSNLEQNPHSICLLQTTQQFSDNDRALSLLNLFDFLPDYFFLVWFCIIAKLARNSESDAFVMQKVTMASLATTVSEASLLKVVYQLTNFLWHDFYSTTLVPFCQRRFARGGRSELINLTSLLSAFSGMK